MKTRTETDSVGSLKVPAGAYYGIQALRARNNFKITGRHMDPYFIVSLAQIKKAAAVTNRNAGDLKASVANAVIAACDEVIAGRLHSQFIVDPIQGGAGTSANMNANEVIANRAIELLGGERGDYSIVHPNDHVNMSQSTNDVFPTAGKLTMLRLIPEALRQMERLAEALGKKEAEFDDVLKMGRTQLQDAVPIRLGQEFGAWAAAVKRDIARLQKVQDELRSVNMGGTAIGTSVNAAPAYLYNITANLQKICGFKLVQAENLIDGTQNLDGFVAVSGAMKTCAVNLSKMANDFRLLSSGPRTGLMEINLPARQNGSSIMPGKVNPVIPEVVSQVAFRIIGNDSTAVLAAEAGQLELNAFEPVLFYSLFESARSLAGAVKTLVDNCVAGITANRDICRRHLEESVGVITALCPYIGYAKSAELAKESLRTGVPVLKLVESRKVLSGEKLKAILDPAAMTGSAQILNVGRISV
ncbi:aspartate ammonia-lyase [Caproiciproducens sp. NJN-50]|uniref:aspartate ammonia-lyase n=1 Tax=Acutalibacteraceae TaxID=3082771 RepID=UPI000FFE2F52|nr:MULTISPECIES: aspartate ammonia-lyase [Acutalibacteraceae]QAT50715.1 aspartate ammonia-lyase [Caproiciproducens sp. NJN-50]